MTLSNLRSGVGRMDIQYPVGLYSRIRLSNLAPNPWKSQRIENSEHINKTCHSTNIALRPGKIDRTHLKSCVIGGPVIEKIGEKNIVVEQWVYINRMS